MKHPLPPVPAEGAVLIGPDDLTGPPGERSLATRDREVIRRGWIVIRPNRPSMTSGPPRRTAAEPVRFNFPGVNRYRPVPWDEWFAVFQNIIWCSSTKKDVSDRA